MCSPASPGRPGLGGTTSRWGCGSEPQKRSGARKGGSHPPALPGGGRTPPAPLRARAVRGALGAASCPAPPGPAPGAGCGRVPPAGSGAGGIVPSPRAGKCPIPAGTGAAPPAVTWAARTGAAVKSRSRSQSRHFPAGAARDAPTGDGEATKGDTERGQPLSFRASCCFDFYFFFLLTPP